MPSEKAADGSEHEHRDRKNVADPQAQPVPEDVVVLGHHVYLPARAARADLSRLKRGNSRLLEPAMARSALHKGPGRAITQAIEDNLAL